MIKYSLLFIIGLSACTDHATTPGNSSTTKDTTMTNATKVIDYASDPRIERHTKLFLKALNTSGGKPLESLTPAEARKVLVDAQAAAKVDLSGIEESEKTIHSDGKTVKLNIVRPAGSKAVLPVFVFIHGGGWVLGDYPTHKRMVRDLVVLTGYAGVFIDYTPTPDAKYPTQLDEIYAATKWVAGHGPEIGVDGKNMAIVGNSVGGNMSTVTCIKAKEMGGPAIKVQILMWPVTNAETTDESWQQFGQDRFLTAPLMKWMYSMYSTDSAELNSIYISPLKASTDQLKGLPPALIAVADNDILRDEGEAYGRKLDEAGVPTTLVRYDGTIHDFGLLNALAESPATKSLFLQAAAELKKYLH
ncbi:MAG TPA: alpha/beta hydrolase [Puia sp.]|jgi:acetyl esterase|nr:alpha/beta hydrolase [Puia sp.]